MTTQFTSSERNENRKIDNWLVFPCGFDGNGDNIFSMARSADIYQVIGHPVSLAVAIFSDSFRTLRTTTRKHLDAVDNPSFSLSQKLAKLSCIPTTTIHWHLTRSLGSAVKHGHWFPGSLMESRKTEDGTLSNESLRELCRVK
jgi:hypothetical protein